MKKFKVYCYLFPDGKRYIGVTKNDISTRRDQGYQHNKELQKAIRSVGWRNITAMIIASATTQEGAFKKERYFISKYRSNEPEYGYNISSGGKATFQGLKHTDEYRKKMSERFKGKTYSPETMEKMKQSHEKERKPVIQYDLSGIFVREHESLGAAALFVGGYKSNITRSIKSKRPYKASIWRVKGGDEG